MPTTASPAPTTALGRLGRAVDHARWMRAFVRYSLMRGNLSAGGVTISALLSMVAGLTIVFTVLRTVLVDHPKFETWLVRSINGAIPGLVTDGDHRGVIDVSTLVSDRAVSLGSIASAVVLVWTATSVMTGLRNSIRSMFGLTGAPLRPVTGKLYDLVGIVLLSVALITTSALVAGSTGAIGQILSSVGMADHSGVAVSVVAVLVAAVMDALVFVGLFRVAAKVRVPATDRWRCAVLGALGWGLLRLLGTGLIGRWENPLLASFAVLVTLLVWLNLGVRWCLYVAAWTANPPHTKLPVIPAEVHQGETPNYVTLSVPHTLDWPHHEVTGTLIPSGDPAVHGLVPPVGTAARQRPSESRSA